LRQAGAKHFLIPNLLNIALLPAAQNNASFAAAATNATNASLTTLLNFEQFLEGIHIYRIDAFSLFADVTRDATHFGFSDITDPCINPVTSAVCSDPDHTLFWDEEHATNSVIRSLRSLWMHSWLPIDSSGVRGDPERIMLDEDNAEPT
jgi:phospholipase/lecithinase/hemolysin